MEKTLQPLNYSNEFGNTFIFQVLLFAFPSALLIHNTYRYIQSICAANRCVFAMPVQCSVPPYPRGPKDDESEHHYPSG